MPHIDLKWLPGRSDALKEEVAQKLMECLMEVGNIPREHISVSIEDVPNEKWEETMRTFPKESLWIEAE